MECAFWGAFNFIRRRRIRLSRNVHLANPLFVQLEVMNLDGWFWPVITSRTMGFKLADQSQRITTCLQLFFSTYRNSGCLAIMATRLRVGPQSNTPKKFFWVMLKSRHLQGFCNRTLSKAYLHQSKFAGYRTNRCRVILHVQYLLIKCHGNGRCMQGLFIETLCSKVIYSVAVISVVLSGVNSVRK